MVFKAMINMLNTFKISKFHEPKNTKTIFKYFLSLLFLSLFSSTKIWRTFFIFYLTDALFVVCFKLVHIVKKEKEMRRTSVALNIFYTTIHFNSISYLS